MARHRPVERHLDAARGSRRDTCAFGLILRSRYHDGPRRRARRIPGWRVQPRLPLPVGPRQPVTFPGSFTCSARPLNNHTYRHNYKEGRVAMARRTPAGHGPRGPGPAQVPRTLAERPGQARACRPVRAATTRRTDPCRHLANPTWAPPTPLGLRVVLRLHLPRPVVPSQPGPAPPASHCPKQGAWGPNLVAKLSGETRHDKLIEEEVFPFEEKFSPHAVIRPRTARADAGSECCERPGTGPLSQGPLSHAAMG